LWKVSNFGDRFEDPQLAVLLEGNHASHDQHAAAEGLAKLVVEFANGGDVDDIVHDQLANRGWRMDGANPGRTGQPRCLFAQFWLGARSASSLRPRSTFDSVG
jgi:hypothetical protein